MTLRSNTTTDKNKNKTKTKSKKQDSLEVLESETNANNNNDNDENSEQLIAAQIFSNEYDWARSALKNVTNEIGIQAVRKVTELNKMFDAMEDTVQFCPVCSCLLKFAVNVCVCLFKLYVFLSP